MTTIQRSTDASTRTLLRPSRGIPHAMTIHVEVIPIRETTTAREVAWEVGDLLAGLTSAERIKRGHVSDHRWDLMDPQGSHNVLQLSCAALVTTSEAASMLNVSTSTVRRMIRRGDLVTEENRSTSPGSITLESVRDVAGRKTNAEG